MKIIAVLLLAVLGYGLGRILLEIAKELALFAVEAWRDVEIRQ